MTLAYRSRVVLQGDKTGTDESRGHKHVKAQRCSAGKATTFGEGGVGVNVRLVPKQVVSGLVRRWQVVVCLNVT